MFAASPKENRTRLFISYAWENATVAEWLARKLMCCGYSIWVDKLFLRGGCTWPNDIDDAIKNKSFRMIHLLSRYSLLKPHPSKERQLGLAMSKRIPHFLIPLNIDGILPEELPWQLIDINYIPFQDWREGFKQLLLTLDDANCPKEFAQTGVEKAIRTYFPVTAVVNEPETLFSNVFKVARYPERLIRFRTEFQFTADKALSQGWPVYLINNAESVSFWPPPDEFASKYKITEVGKESCLAEKMDGVQTYNILSALLRCAVYAMALRKGFTLDDKKNLVFPKCNDAKRFPFKCFDGKATWFTPWGYCHHNGVRLDYALSFRPSVITIDREFHVIISLHISTYYGDGRPVEPTKRLSVRKAISKAWWNHQWYVKYSGVLAFLSDNSDEMSLGTNDEDKVVVLAKPITGMSPVSLVDDVITKISKARASKLSQGEILAIHDQNDDGSTQDEE